MEINKNFKKNIDNTLLIKTSTRISLVFPTLYTILNNCKNKIDENNNEWDRMKKVRNPYELIHLSFNKDKIIIALRYIYL